MSVASADEEGMTGLRDSSLRGGGVVSSPSNTEKRSAKRMIMTQGRGPSTESVSAFLRAELQRVVDRAREVAKPPVTPRAVAEAVAHGLSTVPHEESVMASWRAIIDEGVERLVDAIDAREPLPVELRSLEDIGRRALPAVTGWLGRGARLSDVRAAAVESIERKFIEHQDWSKVNVPAAILEDYPGMQHAFQPLFDASLRDEL